MAVGSTRGKEIGEAESQSAHERRGTVLISLAGGDDLGNTESRDTSCCSFAVAVRLAARARGGSADACAVAREALRARRVGVARDLEIGHTQFAASTPEVGWALAIRLAGQRQVRNTQFGIVADETRVAF